MISMRPEYDLKIEINGSKLSKVIIDQHYKIKHSELDDELILSLVKHISGMFFKVEDKKGNYEFFAYEPVFFKDKPYRLVMVLNKKDDFLGIVNAFRVPRRKK